MSNIITKKEILEIIAGTPIIIPKHILDKINELNELIKNAALLGLFYVIVEKPFWYGLMQHEIDYIHDQLLNEKYSIEEYSNSRAELIRWNN